MIRPCPITPNTCPGADSPITNLSSEAPDPLLFAGVGWDPYNPYRPPPLGDGPAVATDCSGVTWSAISQEMADLLAQLNAANCITPDPPGPPGPGPDPLPPQFPPFPDFTFTPPVGDPQSPWRPPQTDYQQFYNEAQTATVSCPNGAIFSYTVPTGTLVSGLVPPEIGPAMVELLNAQALAFALQQVWGLRVCIEVPGMTQRVPPTIPPTPSPPLNSPGNGPTLAANPGWCCFGESLIPGLNTYTVGSGITEFAISISGNIPPGTSFNQIDAHTAVLEGFPSAPGTYTYTIIAVQTNGSGTSVQITDTLNVLGITTTALMDGTVGTPYFEQITGAGGTPPFTFTALGALPPGLSIDSAGNITGTPTTPGTY